MQRLSVAFSIPRKASLQPLCALRWHSSSPEQWKAPRRENRVPSANAANISNRDAPAKKNFRKDVVTEKHTKENEPVVLKNSKLPFAMQREIKSALPQLQTVFDVYRFAVSKFSRADLAYGHSTMTPWEDAAFLLLHELALPHSDPVQHWGAARLTEEEREHLLSLVFERIHTRKPLPYLINGVYQQGEYFYVDERVLIPRSFIGDILKNRELVRINNAPSLSSSASSLPLTDISSAASPEKDGLELDYNDYFGEITDPTRFAQDTTTQRLSEKKKPVPPALFDHDKIDSVLDLCTGSGCLGILATKFLPNVSRVDIVDISEDALDVARYNVEMKGLEDVISIYQGDLFDALPTFYEGDVSLEDELLVVKKNDDAQNKKQQQQAQQKKREELKSYYNKYDLIISNPPYVTQEDMRHLPKEYQHEPSLALEAGKDGLSVVTRLLRDAQAYLNDGGGLLCEVGQCKPALEKRFKKVFGPHSKKVHWIKTENSEEEVFFIKKEHLNPEYFM